MSCRYQAILFDFDGTLADSYEAITASVNHVRGTHALPPLAQSQVRTLVGHGLLQLMADVVPLGEPEQNAAIYREHHPSVMFQHTRLLPGVAQSLETLRHAGIRMAVCSNKPVEITRKLLQALQLTECIPLDAAFGPEDAPKPKPDPGMVHVALAKLHTRPENTLFVGDMPVDVETARNAGIDVWVLPTGSSDLDTLRQANPDHVLRSMDELVSVLRMTA